MKSKYDGQRVIHVDGAATVHSGVIVGQSKDGKRVYVQSDSPTAPIAKWHFRVDAKLVPVLIKNAKLSQK